METKDCLRNDFIQFEDFCYFILLNFKKLLYYSWWIQYAEFRKVIVYSVK